MINDDTVQHGKHARRKGLPLDANPWFGGGKREAANQLKWEMGWKEEDARQNAASENLAAG